MSKFKDLKSIAVERSVNYEAGPLSYYSLPVEHPLVKLSRAIHSRQVLRNFSEQDAYWLDLAGIDLHDQELDTAVCKSKQIISLFSTPGKMHWGSAGMNNAMLKCKRHLEGIDDYGPCTDVCDQPGHAEVMATIKYLLAEGMDYRTLKYISPEMQIDSFGQVRQMGAVQHQRLLEVIHTSKLQLPPETIVYLHNVEYCCLNCAEILINLGVNTIYNCPQTHQESYLVREKVHEV